MQRKTQENARQIRRGRQLERDNMSIPLPHHELAQSTKPAKSAKRLYLSKHIYACRPVVIDSALGAMAMTVASLDDQSRTSRYIPSKHYSVSVIRILPDWRPPAAFSELSPDNVYDRLIDKVPALLLPVTVTTQDVGRYGIRSLPTMAVNVLSRALIHQQSQINDAFPSNLNEHPVAMCGPEFHMSIASRVSPHVADVFPEVLESLVPDEIVLRPAVISINERKF